MKIFQKQLYRKQKIRDDRWILLIFGYIICSFIMILYRKKIGYKTPDEINFYFNNYIDRATNLSFSLINVNSDGLNFKYYVTSKIFQTLINYGENFIYFFHITLVSLAFFYSYKVLIIKHKIINPFIWTLLFFLPNVIFFSASILRDIQIFSCVVLLLSFVKDSGFISLKTITVFALIFLLRPELAIIIALSYTIICIKNIKLKKYALYLTLIISFSILFYLGYCTDFFEMKFERSFFRNLSVGIYGFNPKDINLLLLFLSNILLFYIPITSDFFIHSKLGNLMMLTMLINFYFFMKIIFIYKFKFTWNDQLVNFCSLNLILFIPIMANETDYSAAVRHVIYILPFLFFYYGFFSKKNKI